MRSIIKETLRTGKSPTVARKCLLFPANIPLVAVPPVCGIVQLWRRNGRLVDMSLMIPTPEAWGASVKESG